MWSRSLYHSILADHKPAIQINLEHLTYGRVCPVDRMKLRSLRPHESESQVQAASTFGSGFDNFARETTRTFKDLRLPAVATIPNSEGRANIRNAAFPWMP
jgi:hypothetical protein